jgi:hypothetical protein
MRTERLDLRVCRNADYFEDWHISDVDGAPIALASITLDLKIRAAAGQGAVLATGTINKYDAANGRFTVRISGSDLSAVAGAGEVVRLAYDLRATYPDGVKAIPVAGQIILTPGATY